MQLSELPERYVPNSRDERCVPCKRTVRYVVSELDEDAFWEDVYGPVDDIEHALDFTPNRCADSAIRRHNSDFSIEVLFWWNGWQWVRKT